MRLLHARRRVPAIIASSALIFALTGVANIASGNEKAQAATTTTVIPYQDTGWKYDDVATGAGDGFQAPSFDDSSWPTGQAAFGSVDPPTCANNDPALVHTNWDLNTDMLIRRHFTAPPGTTSLHLDGTVDNNADVYLNGTLLGHVDSGNCATGAIDLDIPASDLTSDNVLAIRGTDLGVADYLDVQLTATQNNTMTVAPGSVVVPWVASVNSNARLQLDLTKDGKDPFCPQGASRTCKPGPTSTASYAYFAKTTTFALKLKNLSTGAKCDSDNTQAARVTQIQPAGSDLIGYQVAFDANCGKASPPDYTGIVADLFVMDSSFRHNYLAPPGGGSQGTDHLVSTLKAYAGINTLTCISGKSLKAVNDLLSIADYAELVSEINSAKFAEKLAEIKAEDFEDLSTKPIPGTSSCAAERIFAQAAVAIHAEAIAAQHDGTALNLNDQLILNGKHSTYQLFVADPAGISPQAGSTIPIVNLTGSEDDLMLVRAILAGLSRTGLIVT